MLNLANVSFTVNFGFASLLAATVSMYHPDYVMESWQVLLVFYAILLVTLVICIFCNQFLPM